jgi:hypothetical protein
MAGICFDRGTALNGNMIGWFCVALCLCVGGQEVLASPANAGGKAGYVLSVPAGSWHRAVTPSFDTKGLQPSMRFAPKSLSAGDVGVLRQAQTAPGPLGLPTPAFAMLMVEAGLLVGSVVVSIGTSVAAQTGGDLTGWKVAGLVLDGVALATSVGMLLSFDLSTFPPEFAILIYVSLGLSAASFIWNVIKFVMYVNRKNKRRARELPERQGPPPGTAVHVAPWGGVDQQGNALGGLALSGRF